MASARLWSAAAIMVPLLVSITGALAAPGRVPEGPIVTTTFPGLAGDLHQLLEGCNVTIWVVAPGGDPHEAVLRPSDALAVHRAAIVVSTGHTGLEARLRSIVAGERLVEIPSIPGLRLKSLPGGGVNLHMPIYDPNNYLVYIDYLAARLSTVLPECAETIQTNAGGLEARVQEIVREYSGLLAGEHAVASEPPAQYAVEWLGARVEVVLSAGHGASPSPEAVQEAERILASGGVAAIIVGPDGKPLTQAGRWLQSLASQYNAPIIRVPAPGLPQPVIEKIEYVVREALEGSG